MEHFFKTHFRKTGDGRVESDGAPLFEFGPVRSTGSEDRRRPLMGLGIVFFYMTAMGFAFHFIPSQSGAEPVTAPPSYAFWYGVHPPMDLLSQFDRIIVEADNLENREISALKQQGGKVLGYLSVGELNPQRVSNGAIDPNWVMGSNLHWNSNIMDLAAEGWRRYLIDRAGELKNRGVEGLFLDTLDSYMLSAVPMEQRVSQQKGLVQLIRQLKARYPDFILMANRGFEVMDRLAPYLDAVAAESLYRGWDNGKQQYLPVDENNRNWLKKTLHKIKSKHKLDIVAIDYLPPEERDLARITARKIEGDGFIPWVADPAFTYMGIGSIEGIPRKILCIYDSRTEGGNIAKITIHKWCAPLLEYMGYIPVYVDLQQELPEEILQGRYMGIVAWMVAPVEKTAFNDWLKKKIKEKIPVALLGDLSILKDRQLQPLLGLRWGKEPDPSQLTAAVKSDLIGFEAEELGRIDHLVPILSAGNPTDTVHLRLTDRSDTSADVVVTGEWGGFAAAAALLDQDFSLSTQWIINPFAFLQQALKLPAIPVPDVTTENGRRLFFIHVDGDGFTQKFEAPDKGYAAQILLEEIFKVYPWPHAVSVIEGDIGPGGIHPEISEKMERIAQRIFALDHVEIAGHSYSRPYHWDFTSNDKSNAQKRWNHPLPLKGYIPELKREILGSVHYIDSRLAPAGKKTTLFFWTGDADPSPKAMAMVAEAGLLNMNGGKTKILNAFPSLSGISGMGRPYGGGEFQTYAPVGSEIDFTNNWTHSFADYRKVIETFDLTDSPRRIKPISVYYHFYSGSKYASLLALKDVYDWAKTQETMPVYAAEYIRKVLNYRSIGICRRSDGSFRVNGLIDLKTLRLGRENGRPRVQNTAGIAGWREVSDQIYLHVGPDSVVEITLGPDASPAMHLHQANGRLSKWRVNTDGGIDFRIQANVPVLMEVAAAKGACAVRWRQGIIRPERIENILTFAFPENDTGDAVLECHV